MEVKEKGHKYALAVRSNPVWDPNNELRQELTFINKEPGRQHPGTTTQEVLRVLLDRTRHCNNCLPHPNNERVIWHLRMALVLHEARALERKVDKGELEPEYIETGEDGHFSLNKTYVGRLDTDELILAKQDWDRACNHDLDQPDEACGSEEEPLSSSVTAEEQAKALRSPTAVVCNHDLDQPKKTAMIDDVYDKVEREKAEDLRGPVAVACRLAAMGKLTVGRMYHVIEDRDHMVTVETDRGRVESFTERHFRVPDVLNAF